MRDQGNIYGIQKVPETEVRSSGDIAMGAGQGAAMGAQAGMMFGPIGAAAGGVIGAGVGLAGGIIGKRQEEYERNKEEGINEFVENLEGRSLRTNYMVAQQAEHGMNAGKYMMAEIEGDGSRKYGEGIGEIHVDKNFNIKSVANGAPTHEEGGMKVMMEEGDVVFPTQNSKKKYNQIMSDIRRYKMGDERALKRLKKERDKLPTDEDYGYVAREGLRMYNDGLRSAASYEEAYKMADEQLGLIPYTGDERERMILQALSDAGWNPDDPSAPNSLAAATAERNELDPDGDGNIAKPSSEYFDRFKKAAEENGLDVSSLQSVIRGSDRSQAGVRERLKDFEIDPDQYAQFLDDFVGEGTNITGRHTGSISTIGPKTTEVTAGLAEALDQDDVSRSNQWVNNMDRYDELGQPTFPSPVEETTTDGSTDPEFTGFMNSGKDPSQIFLKPDANIYEEIGPDNLPESAREAGEASGGYLANNSSFSPGAESAKNKVNKEKSEGRFTMDDVAGAVNNFGKYSSALYNLAKGLEPAEKVTRRSIALNPYTYRDTSAQARSENVENRNFMARQFQGRVDRSGSLGTMAQVSDAYLDQSERINAGERQRQFAVEQANNQLINQVQAQNVQIARQDDQLDAANRGAQEAFLGNAAKQASELAMLGEQRQYMMSVDEARMEMEKDARKYIGTKDFGVADDGNIAYQPNTKKETKLAPGSYTMLPDGTIVISG